MGIHFEVDAEAVIAELDRLAKGPDPAIFESIMTSTFGAVDAKVHELTGYLRSTGHMASSHDGYEWKGTISFARYPGIYELARGNTPTLNHPEGGHHFFEPAYGTEDEYKDAIMKWLAEGSGD